MISLPDGVRNGCHAFLLVSDMGFGKYLTWDLEKIKVQLGSCKC